MPQIERIPPCSARELLDNYVAPARPVIITGLLDHLPYVGAFENVMERFTEIQFEDKGPGIPDIDRALQDGFSTGGGMGLGLPGARRLMNEFELASTAGLGTRVSVVKWKP